MDGSVKYDNVCLNLHQLLLLGAAQILRSALADAAVSLILSSWPTTETAFILIG